MKTETIIILGVSAVALYLIWQGKKGNKQQEQSNASGDIQSYSGKGGRKVCYVVSPRGSMQEVPCP